MKKRNNSHRRKSRSSIPSKNASTSSKKIMSITFSQALEGYTLHAEARRLSHHTLRDYFNTFNKFQRFLGEDVPLDMITKQEVEQFLASFTKVKDKTILNYHTGLSALWTWALEEELVDDHIIRQIVPPDPEQMDIVPFTEQDVKLMLAACDRSRVYQRTGQLEKSSHALPNPERNKAIILTLLDTGLRASELCRATIGDADLRNKRITVALQDIVEKISTLTPQSTFKTS